MCLFNQIIHDAKEKKLTKDDPQGFLFSLRRLLPSLTIFFSRCSRFQKLNMCCETESRRKIPFYHFYVRREPQKPKSSRLKMIAGWPPVLPEGSVLPASPWTFCGLRFPHIHCRHRDYMSMSICLGKIAFFAPKFFKQWKLEAV